MDKQRIIYRKLIVDLFKKNFDSALFVEKCDVLMKENDFEIIRDEVEEEYFVKNRGIAPYINAIKYLQSKIEACTEAATLFVDIEDYIYHHKHIVITKIAKAPEIHVQKVKTLKRKKQQPKPAVHAKCKTPNSCRKCNIMKKCQIDDVASTKQKLKQKKDQNIVLPDEKNSHTEPCKPQYSDISDSETMDIRNNMEPSIKKEEKMYNALPYDDHKYSRICFYGSGVTEDAAKGEEEKAVENGNSNEISVPKEDSSAKVDLKPKSKPVPNLLPKNSHRFKQNIGLRQIAPAHFQKHTTVPSSSSPSVFLQAPDVIRPTPRQIMRPIPRQIMQPISQPHLFLTPQIPINFNASVRFIHPQPVYYIQYCEPPKQ